MGSGAGNGAGIGSGHGGDVDGISITGGKIVVEPRSQTINEKYMGVGIGAGADSSRTSNRK